MDFVKFKCVNSLVDLWKVNTILTSYARLWQLSFRVSKNLLRAKLKNDCMATHGGGHTPTKMLYTPRLMDGLIYSVGSNPGYSVPAGPMLLTHGSFSTTQTHRRGQLISLFIPTK